MDSLILININLCDAFKLVLMKEEREENFHICLLLFPEDNLFFLFLFSLLQINFLMHFYGSSLK